MSVRKLPATTPSSERPAYQRGLRVGNPGNKGGSDIPDTLRMWRANLLRDETARRQYEAILKDKDHPHFMRAFQNLEERVEGKVPQATILSGDQAKPLRIVIERESAQDES